MIRVELPYHLQRLAGTGDQVEIEVSGVVTHDSLLSALETRFPTLRGMIRDHTTGERRPHLRYFACRQDLSLQLPDEPLPESVQTGTEPYIIIGAVAGG